MFDILTPSNRALKICSCTVTSQTKVIPQTGRAFSFTGTLCSSAVGIAVSTGRADREVKQKFAPLGSLCDKGPKFLTIISGKCQEEEAYGKAHCHMQALHRNQPLHLHFSSRSTKRSGRPRHSFPDEQRFWCCDSASEQETVESHSYPAVPPRACKTNAIVPLPSPITLSKRSPQVSSGQVVAESRPKTPHQQGN